MQISHLSTFLAVVDHGSLAAAARELFVAPSRVTERMQRLESELHATLLDRSGRRIMPTQAGLALVPQARAVIRQLEVIRQMFPADAVQRLRVGVRSLPIEVITSLRATLERAVPGRVVETLPLDSDTQVAMIQTGGLECGFVWSPPPPPLRCIRVYTEELAIVVPATARYAKLPSVAPEDLVGLRLASAIDPLTIPAPIGPYLSYLPRCDRVNAAVLGGTHLLVSGGQHCAFVPISSTEHFVLSTDTLRDIVIKPLREPAPSVSTYFTWHPDFESTTAFEPVRAAVEHTFLRDPISG